MRRWDLSSIRRRFQRLSQSSGQVTHVLLTRSPLFHPASWASSFDLHVLSTPPAFVLSQDQTLRKETKQNHQRNKPATCEFDLTKTNIITDVQFVQKESPFTHTPKGADGRDNKLAFDNQVHTIEFSRTRRPPYSPKLSERQPVLLRTVSHARCA